jgi:redox-sensitive bicupin YhaK (pirin superfamily)
MTRETNDGPEAITAVRALGPPPWPTRDPFLFCVHHDDAYPAGNERLGPASSLAGRNLGMDFEGKDGWRMYHGHVVPGFPQHPHRGFETVTVVRRGLLDHSDSLGAAARYGRGDVQWLTAGAGILHAEMFPLLDPSGPNPVELFQIWLNLPRVNKFAKPYFSMLWGDSVPRHVARDADQRVTEVTLVAGRIGDLVPPRPPPDSWAAQAGADVAIWTIKMDPGARWQLPRAAPGTNRTLYFFRGGSLGINGRSIPPSHLVELRGDAAALLENGGDAAELLLLQGRPINEPVVHYGPFVMSSGDEIRQAYLDYQRTRFGGWPWQGDDPVHPRQEGRFARHADGRIERPA